MIKYGIFIQGGESMKKAISILLLTVMCAMVFVGCGSGESTPTSSISIQSNNEYKDLTVGQNVDLEGWVQNHFIQVIVMYLVCTLETIV